MVILRDPQHNQGATRRQPLAFRSTAICDSTVAIGSLIGIHNPEIASLQQVELELHLTRQQQQSSKRRRRLRG